MTPLRAIETECRNCMNGTLAAREKCSSQDCHLSLMVDGDISNVRRIKAHCLTCVPEQSIFGVRECDGKVLTPAPHKCPLHPYRLGKNPKRKGAGNAEHLRPYHFKSGEPKTSGEHATKAPSERF